MASVIPKEVKKEIIDGWITEIGDWYVALFLSTSNCETQSLYSGCTNQVAGGVGGYTTGGNILTGRVSAYVDTTNAFLDATNVQWTSATFTARYAVVYNTTTSKIRGVYYFSIDKTVTGGTFTIQWSSSGLIKIS